MTPGATPRILRDADGIALGGIRTPPVDVPVATLSGVPGPNPSMICLLLGSTKPFSERVSRSCIRRAADYEQRFAESADATIAAGFGLDDDRATRRWTTPIRRDSGVSAAMIVFSIADNYVRRSGYAGHA